MKNVLCVLQSKIKVPGVPFSFPFSIRLISNENPKIILLGVPFLYYLMDDIFALSVIASELKKVIFKNGLLWTVLVIKNTHVLTMSINVDNMLFIFCINFP